MVPVQTIRTLSTTQTVELLIWDANYVAAAVIFAGVLAICKSSALNAAHVWAEATAKPAKASVNPDTPNITAAQNVYHKFESLLLQHKAINPWGFCCSI